MKLKLTLGLAILLTLALAVAQEGPPSLRDFHQLYGVVTNLPEGTFALKATVGGNDFTTSIDAQGRYGYSPTFKVRGQSGETITFALVNSLGLSTNLETTTAFQSGSFSQINLAYPGTEGQTAEVHGCMNATATNYNAQATVDDDSCQFEEEEPEDVEGCMVEEASNYDVSATEDDGSCTFADDVVVGCMNESASDYNASATVEYGKCVFLRGCMNETAVNYDEKVVIEDDSCVFEEDNVTVVPCLMNWECGVWGACIGGQQTRSCLRVDNCDSLVAQEIATLTTVPKPTESKSCQAATETARICTPNAKRCSGTNLEQCSLDGRKWNLLQSCPHGCSSVSLRCQAAPTQATDLTTTTPDVQEPFPTWIIYLIAGLVLAGIIGGGVFFVINQRKYAPLKKYIKESEGKGYPKRQIKSRLINQGWDPEKINKLLK